MAKTQIQSEDSFSTNSPTVLLLKCGPQPRTPQSGGEADLLGLPAKSQGPPEAALLSESDSKFLRTSNGYSFADPGEQGMWPTGGSRRAMGGPGSSALGASGKSSSTLSAPINVPLGGAPRVTVPGDPVQGQTLPNDITSTPIPDRPGYGSAIVNGRRAIADLNTNRIFQISDQRDADQVSGQASIVMHVTAGPIDMGYDWCIVRGFAA
jgi:hypothetical protein